MSRQRVLLVSPDYRDSPEEVPSLPVGLGYVARGLESAVIPYEVSDLNVERESDLERRLAEFQPEVVGIRLISFRQQAAYELLRRIRIAAPDARIIAGGPHLTADREGVLRDCDAIDLGVVGEGEQTFMEILGGAPASRIPGVLYREGGEVRFTGPRAFIADLDTVPFPTYTGFRVERYQPAIPLASSRGCPYGCIFCGAPRLLGRKWRARTAQAMAREVEWWVGRGARVFVINDSNFAIDRARVEEFCREVSKRGWDIDFAADGIRADHLDEPLLRLMRAARFSRLAIGVESASDAVLARLRKGETRAQIEKAIALATGLGFDVILFFIIGSPGESVADVEASFALAERYPVENVFFFSMTPIPGTPFHEWALERGYRPRSTGRYLSERFGFSDRLEFEPDGMTAEQARQCLARARKLELRIRARARRRRLLRGLMRRLFGARAVRRFHGRTD